MNSSKIPVINDSSAFPLYEGYVAISLLGILDLIQWVSWREFRPKMPQNPLGNNLETPLPENPIST